MTEVNFLTDKMCIYDTLLKLVIREVCYFPTLINWSKTKKFTDYNDKI